MDDQNGAATMPPGKALLALIVVVVWIAAFVGIHTLLGISAYFAGFVVTLYFSLIKGNAPSELPPAVAGALGGILVAALMHILPAQYGVAGGIVVGVLILGAIFALLAGFFPVLINPAFMLFLTIGTIPAVQAEGQFIGMACSVLIGGAFAGAGVLAGRFQASRGAAVKAD